MSTIIWKFGREIRGLGEKRGKGDPFLASGSRFGTQEPIIFLGCPLTLLVSSRKTEYITLLQYSIIVPYSRFIKQSVTFCYNALKKRKKYLETIETSRARIRNVPIHAYALRGSFGPVSSEVFTDKKRR